MERPLRKRKIGGARSRHGFTLVEMMLSVVILGLTASVMSAVYFTGMKTMDAGIQRVMADSFLRSKMEELLSMKFNQLASGSQTVTLDGAARTLSWTVQSFDVNGDGAVEDKVKQVTVQLEGRSLTTLVADNEGKVKKVS